MKQNFFFLFGSSGSGKTTKAWEIARKLAQKGYKAGGIVSPGTFLEGKRSSFDVLDLMNGEKRFLAKRDMASSIIFGPFGFSQEGFAFGHQAIQNAILQKVDLLIIDEIGPLELKNQGWAESLKKACENGLFSIMITVRPGILAEIKNFFFSQKKVMEVPVEDAEKILDFF